MSESCGPMDWSPPGSSVHGISRQEYWSGLPFPSPEDLPDLGIEPRSPALQADSLLTELLRKAFLSLLAILWNSAFRCLYLSISPLPLALLLFSAICKTSSDNHFAFLHFFFLGMVLIPASCTMSQTPSVVLQALCLSDLVP